MSAVKNVTFCATAAEVIQPYVTTAPAKVGIQIRYSTCAGDQDIHGTNFLVSRTTIQYVTSVTLYLVKDNPIACK